MSTRTGRQTQYGARMAARVKAKRLHKARHHATALVMAFASKHGWVGYCAGTGGMADCCGLHRGQREQCGASLDAVVAAGAVDTSPNAARAAGMPVVFDCWMNPRKWKEGRR